MVKQGEMKEVWKQKWMSWRGRCGAYAKHKGKDKTLERMNRIRFHYWALYSICLFGKIVDER